MFKLITMFLTVIAVAVPLAAQGPSPTPLAPAPQTFDFSGRVAYLNGALAGITVDFAQDPSGDYMGKIAIGGIDASNPAKVINFVAEPAVHGWGVSLSVNTCGIELRAVLVNGPGETWSTGVRDERSPNTGSTDFTSLGGVLEGALPVS